MVVTQLVKKFNASAARTQGGGCALPATGSWLFCRFESSLDKTHPLNESFRAQFLKKGICVLKLTGLFRENNITIPFLKDIHIPKIKNL
jgi:hypothetical protein